LAVPGRLIDASTYVISFSAKSRADADPLSARVSAVGIQLVSALVWLD